MLTAVLAWFTPKIGKTVATWSLAVATAAAFYWRIYESGRNAEKTAEAQRDAETITRRKTVDEKVDRMPDADVRAQLSRWVRHDS